MSLKSLFDQIQALPFADAIRTSAYGFPTVETVHVAALVMVIGSIAMVDLRLMDVAGKEKPARQIIREVLPWTWGAFIVAAITGSALFASNANQYWVNKPFRIKMILMLVAGVNMIFFHLVLHKHVEGMEDKAPTPTSVRTAGALSIALWAGIVFAGRWIGFAL
jgi:hypothetical protein